MVTAYKLSHPLRCMFLICVHAWRLCVRASLSVIGRGAKRAIQAIRTRGAATTEEGGASSRRRDARCLCRHCSGLPAGGSPRWLLARRRPHSGLADEPCRAFNSGASPSCARTAAQHSPRDGAACRRTGQDLRRPRRGGRVCTREAQVRLGRVRPTASGWIRWRLGGTTSLDL